ncbi:microtubule organization protein AKNA [Myripristis murdjan]|uniref:microtubule organization protein AKNA n=1 Tax=Myripristis murdjan TaxID=586833 RepID=UPI0011762CC0|nr:microtubule organization protein AKNA-like [Myripristis murdjan]XP_029921162.1 microtubule organization protein AKNA-like [Myripristis murdjan]XP_029921163.1 microtubule organization protein AKNA-like [Myripristis murdjan]XP_029921164.1 microtubule organization protein AKNA-like [Myripristis murdjan]
MGTRKKNTTAGVLFWTPAPLRISPTSSVASEDEWEDEDEGKRTEKEEDFDSQMDENGIIGLKEALEDVELGETYDNEDAECSLNPEEASSGGHSGSSSAPELRMPPEDLSHNDSELQDSEPLSHTEQLGQDTHILSPYADVAGSLEVWTEEDEEVRQREEEDEQKWLFHRQTTGHLLQLGEQLHLTKEEENGKGEEKKRDSKRKQAAHTSIVGSSTAGCVIEHGLTESCITKGDNERTSLNESYNSDLLTLEAAGSSKRSCVNGAADSVVYGSGNISPLSPSNLIHPTSQFASTPSAPAFPHLLHFSSGETADVPLIEAETFPEMGCTESLPESHSTRLSHSPKPQWLHESDGEELKHRASRTSPQPVAISPEQRMSNGQHGVCNGPIAGSRKSNTNHRKHHTSSRKMRQCSPEATYSRTCTLNKSSKHSSKSNCWKASPEREVRTPQERAFKTQTRTTDADADEARSGPLSYRTPDFSRVEPRVRFPKSGYKPPKSRGSSKTSVSAEPPLVFKSPADIVREVLLSSTDDFPQPFDSTTPASAPNSTVPEEFRCPQQATTLIEQLQEDYNRLLTKYAEAENTIDRLRLEAKVNLYSDPPKPSHSVQSGVIQKGSKLMTLTFPQAQRAEISSSSAHVNGPSAHQRDASRPSSTASITPRRSLGPQVGQHLTRTLSKQAEKFFQQVQTFESLLKSGKLKPSEQMKGLSQLVQGLDSLERAYLIARDEHRVLEHRGAEDGPFDPNRELEGLIFQCGMCVEELKEQVEQMGRDQPTSVAPSSPPPNPTPLSLPADRGEPTPRPQSPVLAVPAQLGEPVRVEVSSASGESDEEEAGPGDEDLPSLLLESLNHKHTLVEEDFSMLMDHYQSFKELPELLDRGLRERVPSSPGAGNGVQHEEGRKDGHRQETAHVEKQNSLPQREAKTDHQDSPHVSTGKQKTSKSDPPSPRASRRSPALPTHIPSGSKRFEVGKSHSSSLTSLGESAASERRGSRLQPGSKRALSQDGIISPETDSGFVGSESSRVTPAAVPGSLHQMASTNSVSLSQEGNQGKPQTDPVSGPALPPSSSKHRRTRSDHNGGSQLITSCQTQGEPLRARRGQRRGPSASSSPQHWASPSPQARADSGTSEFGLDSNHTHTVSEEEEAQSDQYTSSTGSEGSFDPSPSPSARYHHSDLLGALSSSQVASRNEAIQNLQAEVTRLKERLESSLRKATPLSPVRAAPSTQAEHTYHNTSTPHIRSGQRRRGSTRGGSGERRIVDELDGECAPRPAARRRSASAPRQRPGLDVTTDSEHDQSTRQPRLSRRIPASPGAPENFCSRPDAVHSRTARTRQRPSPSVGLSEAAGAPDRRGSQVPVCQQCSSRHRAHSARPVGGDNEPTHTSSHCHHCPLCGRPELHRSTQTEPARRTEREAAGTHRSCQTTESLDRGGRGGYLAAPAPAVLGNVPLVQCVPVCPPSLLLYPGPVMKLDSYPQPLYVSGVGASSGVRGREEARDHPGRSLSADERRSLNSSLRRAIKAARDMKHTSRRMARSLATGLHHQESLSQSCTH